MHFSTYEERNSVPIGTSFYFGKTNFGRDDLWLPLERRTKTQLVCSDGTKTERIMIGTGMIVGRRGPAYLNDA